MTNRVLALGKLRAAIPVLIYNYIIVISDIVIQDILVGVITLDKKSLRS